MASVLILRRWTRLGSLAGVWTATGWGELAARGERERADGDVDLVRQSQAGLDRGTLCRKAWVGVGEHMLGLGGKAVVDEELRIRMKRAGIPAGCCDQGLR